MNVFFYDKCHLHDERFKNVSTIFVSDSRNYDIPKYFFKLVLSRQVAITRFLLNIYASISHNYDMQSVCNIFAVGSCDYETLNEEINQIFFFRESLFDNAHRKWLFIFLW